MFAVTMLTTGIPVSSGEPADAPTAFAGPLQSETADEMPSQTEQEEVSHRYSQNSVKSIPDGNMRPGDGNSDTALWDSVMSSVNPRTSILSDSVPPEDAMSQSPEAPAPSAAGGPDAYGYSWIDSKVPTPQINFSWVDISATGTDSGLVGDDGFSSASVGFTFGYYGNSYSTAYFSTNGLISFGAGTALYSNSVLPSTANPNNILAAYWDDLSDGGGTIYYQTLGTSPNRMFVVEWHDWYTLGGAGPMTFEIILFETGDILYQYSSLGTATGGSATVGIENSGGTIGLQYSYNSATALQANLAILFFNGPLQYDCVMSPADQTNYGPAGSAVDHIITVSNTGTEDDTYSLSTGDVLFNGLTWNKQGMVVDIGGVYDVRIAMSPCVILDGGMYKMWYAGNDGTNSHILYATSPDGSNWTKQGLVLDHGAWYDSVQVSDPSVLYLFGEYKMWYSAYNGTTNRIAYANSTDGINWVKQGVVLNAGWAGELHAALPNVMYDEGIYKMWYNNYVSAYNTNYATSPDGINWTKHGLVLAYGEVNAEQGIYSPDVLRIDGHYHMWYSGKSASGTVRILYADSPDGLSWTRHGTAIIYGPAYETNSVDRSCTIMDGNTVRMWYSGYVWSTPAYTRIMYATQPYSSDTALWPTVFRDISDTADITEISVAAGDIASFITRVAIPPSAIPGDFDAATVFATSQGNAVLQRSSDVRTEAILIQNYSVLLNPGFQSGIGIPGAETFYNLNAVNNGLYEDTYELLYANNNYSWPVRFYDMNMTEITYIGPVPPGGSIQFIAGVDVFSGAALGDIEFTGIYALSWGDPAVWAEAMVRTTINAPYLLVDDDSGLSTDLWFDQAFLDLGYSYDYWDTQVSGIPPLDYMLLHTAVIWMTGDNSGGSITPGASGDTLSVGERNSVASYLDGGGRLYMSSGGLGWDGAMNGWSSWILQYLGAQATNGGAGAPYGLEGIAEDTIGDGLAMTIHQDDYCGQLSGLWTSGSLGASSGPAMLWVPDMTNALVKTDNGVYRSAYTSFDLSDVGAPENRSALLQRILFWLQNGDVVPDYRCNLEPELQTGTGAPGDFVYYSLTVSNTGAMPDIYSLSYTNGMQPWPITFYDGAWNPIIFIGPVSPGNSSSFYAEVSIPPAAQLGDFDIASVAAMSMGLGSYTDTVQIQTMVPYQVFPPTNVALFQTQDPWGLTAIRDILTAWGITYTVFGPADIGIADLSPYDKVIIVGSANQDSSLYAAISANKGWFESYVAEGGVLNINAADWGGFTDMPFDLSSNYLGGETVDISVPNHPLLVAPNIITDAELDGWGNSYLRFFTAWPTWAETVLTEGDTGASWPVLLEFPWGAGRVIATTQPVEYSWQYQPCFLLENLILAMNGTAVLPDYAVSIVPEGQGQIVQPGNQADYYFTLTNYGILSDAYDLQFITYLLWNVTFYDMGWSQITALGPVPSGSSTNFIARVQVPTDAQPGTWDATYVVATSQNDPMAYDWAIAETHTPITAPFFDDMESASPMIYSNSSDQSLNQQTFWQWGDPSGYAAGPGGAFSGSRCWGSNLLSEYEWGADSFLTLPPVDSAATAVRSLRFSHWYYIDSPYEDGGWAEISTDNGATWSQLTPTDGYPSFTENGVPGYSDVVPCFAGASGWAYSEFDLSPYSGQMLLIRLRFWSEGWNEPGFPGWYVDDISITVPQAYDVLLTPDFQVKTGTPGADTDHYLRVTNRGLNADTYDLSYINNNLPWPITFYETVSIPAFLNPSFETGDFSGWVAQDIVGPFDPLRVVGPGYTPGFGLFQTEPTEGSWSAYNGFDGAGPGTISLAQDIFVPSSASQLTFDYRAAWDMLNYSGSTMDREFRVEVEPFGGGAALYSELVLVAPAGTSDMDTGPLVGSIDISAFANMSVRVSFEWYIPNNYAGPGAFQLDNIKVYETMGSAITSVGPLAPGAGTDIIARVSVPMGAQPGDYDTADIFATSQGNASAWDTAQVLTELLPYSFSLEPETQGSMGSAGADMYYLLELANTGPEDSYNLTYWNSYLPWPVSFLDLGMNPLSGFGPVPTGGTVQFYAVVSIPPTALPGEFDIANIYVSSFGDPSISDIAEVNTRIPGPLPYVLLLHTDDGNAEPLRSQLVALGDVETIDVFDARAATPSLSYLQFYDVVLTWTNYPYQDSVSTGNNLADYIDGGGRVINMMFSYGGTAFGLDGRFVDEMYGAMDGTGTLYGSANLGTFDASHPIMEGVTAVSDYYRLDGTYITPGSHEVARWSDGLLFVAAKNDRSAVSIAGYPGFYREWTGQMDLVVHNAINWLVGNFVIQPYSFDLEPESQAGIGSPGADVYYNLTIRNSGTETDTYDLASSSIWPVTYLDTGMNPVTSLGPVLPGGSVYFWAQVSIPAGATPGDYDIADIYAFSQGNISISDAVQVRTDTPFIALLPWYDDMESGVTWWQAEGLWHPVQDGISPYPNSHSPTQSWWYGQDSTGTYNTGSSANSGRLVTPLIDLTGVTDAELSFWEWYETEGGYPNWDRRYVQIDAGMGWQNITQLDESAMNTWQERAIDLTPYCGNLVRLGFFFNTMDGAINDFQGWYVDDISVESTADIDPPVHSNESPEDGSRISDTSPIISLEVTDATGVDLATVRLYINGFNVFSDKTPIADGYLVSYIHEGTFADGETVSCRIVARDVYGYLMDWTWTFTVDTSAPYVVSVTPADGEAEVPLDTSIEVVFSEPMNQTSANMSFHMSPTVAGSFSWAGTVLIFTPTLPLTFNLIYVAGVASTATDIAGNSLANITWSFSTGDLTPPGHSDESPAIDGYTSVTDPVISVHVTDPYGIDLSTVRLYVQGFRVDCGMTPVPGGYNVSYWHESGFTMDEVVACRIVARDICGNLLDFTWYFTVSSMPIFYLDVHPGWNLLSLPLLQANTSVPAVLASIDGQWDSAKCYDPTDPADPWKTYRVGSTSNDLATIDHTMGFWLHALANTTLEVHGQVPSDTEIILSAGWNLVGYPTLNGTVSLADALFGTGYDGAEGFDAGAPSLLVPLNSSYTMQPGEGYWIHVPADTSWTVSFAMPVPGDDACAATDDDLSKSGVCPAPQHSAQPSVSEVMPPSLPVGGAASGAPMLFLMALLAALFILALRKRRP